MRSAPRCVSKKKESTPWPRTPIARSLQTIRNSALAWTNLGNAETALGRRPAAEEAFRKALELDPDSADALNNLAWLLFEDKRIDEA